MTSPTTLLIAPRYLAGPDAAATAAIGRLLRAAGWRERHVQGGTGYRTSDSWRFTARTAPG
ncbi:hypothetical protein ACFYXM_11820 [Streptomyces sp. NPDC002476]|uniref:hypothetical protein n=1 Tax=Streptomyces sp. NPDC002476 TaxID=3364648 RepID=UPI0036BD3976